MVEWRKLPCFKCDQKGHIKSGWKPPLKKETPPEKESENAKEEESEREKFQTKSEKDLESGDLKKEKI